MICVVETELLWVAVLAVSGCLLFLSILICANLLVKKAPVFYKEEDSTPEI